MAFYMESKYVDTFDLVPWAIGGAFYIVGATIYMLKIPERFKPGRFDIWGSSHQIFHICILIASWTIYQ